MHRAFLRLQSQQLRVPLRSLRFFDKLSLGSMDDIDIECRSCFAMRTQALYRTAATEVEMNLSAWLIGAFCANQARRRTSAQYTAAAAAAEIVVYWDIATLLEKYLLPLLMSLTCGV